MKKESDISFLPLFPSQSEDDASMQGLPGFGRRLPEASLKSDFGHKKCSWDVGTAVPSLCEASELGLPYITQAYCSFTFWGKYQMTIFKGSGVLIIVMIRSHLYLNKSGLYCPSF